MRRHVLGVGLKAFIESECIVDLDTQRDQYLIKCVGVHIYILNPCMGWPPSRGPQAGAGLN